MTTKAYTVEDAERLIESEDVRWFDFCSSVGHIPGNVAHMRCIHRDFATYLNEGA